MHGGENGERGCAYWMRKSANGELRKTKLRPSQTIDAVRGERLIIHTPGGGGYGIAHEQSIDSDQLREAIVSFLTSFQIDI
jgi:5-oxoprolinase (ATP-hydrolysing)